MTNNPTIDGVSRITIEPGCDFIEGFLIPTIKVKFPPCHVDDDESLDARDVAGEQIRALLDAPVVERQQPFAWLTDDYLTDKSSTTYDELTSARWKDKGWSVQPLYIAPPEVAALQSTIAQLQARVAELESGRGEPVAWANGEQLKLCAASPREAQPNNPMIHNRPRNIADSALKTDYCNTPLFTAPPAPVAADKYDEVLLPFLSMMRNELHANAGKGDRPGWLAMTPGECLLEIYYHLGKLQKGVKDGNDLWITEYSADVANMAMMLADICGCLDATAALNGERK